MRRPSLADAAEELVRDAERDARAVLAEATVVRRTIADLRALELVDELVYGAAIARLRKRANEAATRIGLVDPVMDEARRRWPWWRRLWALVRAIVLGDW